MLHYALVFLLIAIVAALFGFGGIAATSANIAKILFLIFLVLFVVSLVGRRRIWAWRVQGGIVKPIRDLVTIGCLGLFVLSGQDFAVGLTAYENHDYATALREWRPLAEKGSAAAGFNLGLLYYDGRGVAQDFTEAAQWFERSAGQGYAKAQYNLGEMYAVGKGVKRDYVQSYMWLSVCAAGGNDTCAEHRDLVGKKLKGSQLSTARRLAQEWKPKDSF
jgi:uncharacterized membrane protein YtjA (UPF0391 family)